MSCLRSRGCPLKIAVLFLLIFSGGVFAQEDSPPALDVEELKENISGEAKSELVALRLGSADVSLRISGYWKGTLQGNFGIALTPLGTQAVSPDSPVLFTQEADLTLDLWIMDRWFVEATFLDDYDVNTYRAGYQGKPGEIVQYVGIGNTGLDFPAFPYLDLGGDSPSSFGYYGRFGGGALNLHTLFRWDQAAREERIFVGGRERSYAYLSPGDSARGLSFVLPDTNIASEIQVFLEDEDGGLYGGGRRWRRAAASEYAAGRARGLVELSRSPSGMVAVAYSGINNGSWRTNSLGEYSPASHFLGEVQGYFGSINLGNYPQSGETSTIPDEPGIFTINGTAALVVYEPGTFSPFERRSRYEAPSSASADAALVTLSAQKRVEGFDLIAFEASVLSADIPLYAESGAARGYFELVKEGGGSDTRGASARWPLANQFPEIYLPASSPFTADISLRFASYGAAGSYAIGTDVVPGSVQVWRQGILDSQFSYNTSAGTVSLANPAGLNEVIRVTYLKRSGDTKSGSIAAGLGAVYHEEGSPFSSELALGVRWNITPDSAFTEEGASSPGTVGLGAKTAWDFDRFKAQVTAGLGFEQPDSTGLYRGEGMEGSEIVLGLPPETSFISHTPPTTTLIPAGTLDQRADLVYRNYRNQSALGNTLMDIDDSSTVVSGENRPYPVRDNALTREANVLAAEFELDGTRNWTGFEVPLGSDASVLARAREIEIPFRFYDFALPPSTENFKLILQIGSLSGEDYSFLENQNLIFEEQLYDTGWHFTSPPPPKPDAISSYNPETFSQSARVAEFSLNDNDRAKLGNATHLRLIAVYTGTGNVSGRVLLAPPVVRGASFRPIIVDSNDKIKDAATAAQDKVRAAEVRESGLQSRYGSIIDRLHPSGAGQQALKVDWKSIAANTSAGADGRTGELPLSNYRSLSFFVKGPADTNNNHLDGGRGTFSFVIARGPDSLDNSEDTYLEAEIPLSAFNAGQWSKVTIRYQGENQGISVDGGNDTGGAYFRYKKPPSNTEGELPAGKANYAAFFVNPAGRKIAAGNMPSNQLPDGSFCVDEIILEEPAPQYRLNGGARLEYSLPGTIVRAGNIPVLADFSVSTAFESEARGDPFMTKQAAGGGINSRSSAGLSLFDIGIKGNVAFSAAEEMFNWDAGHELSRAIGPVRLGESFQASPRGGTARHRLNAALSAMVHGNFDAEAYYDQGREDRKWNLALGFTPPVSTNAEGNSYIPSVNAAMSALWFTKNYTLDGNNYGDMWARTWRPMMPDLGAGADGRETSGSITLTENTKPLGAILSLDGRTSFIGAANTTRAHNRTRLDLPLALNDFSFNFQMERGFRRYLRYSGADALNDGGKFGESIGDSLPLWGVFPFYSLFAPSLNDAMSAGLENSPSKDSAEYTWFNDLFGITAQFPALYDLKAFFVPVSAAFGLERVLEQKLDTRTDTLNLRGSLGFSAINMFGAFGYKPLFTFYQNDDFSSALETVVALPRGEDAAWRIQWGTGAAFHGFSGGELGFGNTLTAASTYWSESFRLDWTTPAEKSLLGVVYSWIARAARTQSSWLTLSGLMSSPYEKLRRETLEFSYNYSEDYCTWNLQAGHESIITIPGRLNFSVFAKLAVSQNQEARSLSFIGTVGTTLNIMF